MLPDLDCVAAAASNVSRAFIHGHPVGELLKGLAVEGDSHSGVGIEGELHAVLDLRLPALLHRSVRIVFVP